MQSSWPRLVAPPGEISSTAPLPLQNAPRIDAYGVKRMNVRPVVACGEIHDLKVIDPNTQFTKSFVYFKSLYVC